MITQAEVRELLHYDPETGVFTWKTRDPKWFPSENSCDSWNTQRSGKKAGYSYKSRTTSYRAITIKSKLYQAHRLAWLYMVGEWPEYEIDHIDGDGLNNRFNNLRDVDHSTNLKNQKIRSTNSSGITGVYWCKARSKWAAYINVDAKMIALGRFDSKDDAAKVRYEAERKYGFHENHGKRL